MYNQPTEEITNHKLASHHLLSICYQTNLNQKQD